MSELSDLSPDARFDMNSKVLRKKFRVDRTQTLALPNQQLIDSIDMVPPAFL
jgi:hypothetical protein